jgi:hypothetical protein
LYNLICPPLILGVGFMLKAGEIDGPALFKYECNIAGISATKV